MLFKAASLDDALGDVLRRLLKHGAPILPGKGRARELTGVLVELSNPRSRFSRSEGRGTLFQFLGETLWYLSGSDRLSHIEYYIPRYREFIKASSRKVKAPGAYGPRLFGGEPTGQIAQLLETMKGKTDTRQAVAQIFERADLKPGNNDVPCTTTLQFLPRAGKLHMIVNMRSNDAYIGFPGDVFAFTFIQELAARTLGMELGTYSHFVGSLHLYDDNQAAAYNYLDEGYHSHIEMPAMPVGDPWESVGTLLETESAIRLKQDEPPLAMLHPYWLDLVRLLRIKALLLENNKRGIALVKGEMASDAYNAFIRSRQMVQIPKVEAQPALPGITDAAAAKEAK